MKDKLLTMLIVVYMIAVSMYAFKSIGSLNWAYYHSTVSLYLVLILFYGMVKKNKTEMDKSLLISIVLLKVFNWLCYTAWMILGSDFQNQPYFFCIIVAMCFFIGIVINKKVLWKSRQYYIHKSFFVRFF